MNMHRTAHTRPWPLILSLPLGILAAVMARYAVLLPWIYADFLTGHPPLQGPCIEAGIADLVGLLSRVAAACAALGLTASLLGMVRRRGSLWLLRAGYVASWLLVVAYGYVVFRITGLLLLRDIPLDGVQPTPATLFFWRYDVIFPAACAGLFNLLLYLCTWRRVVINLYTGAQDMTPAPGDRILENLRTHGRDPMYRKSLLSSVGTHLLVIVIIPWLISFWGCVEAYRVPKGSGSPQIAGPVKIIKVQRVKKKKKKFLLNSQSAISFHVPDLDESEVSKNVEEATQLTYKADPSRVLGQGSGPGGKLGAGNAKGPGGWPDGMDNAVVRFIRLEYNGAGWDGGMDAISRADLNFLDAFKKLTGFKVARQSESHPVALLRKYPKGFAPPFMYMTGNGNITVSAGDVKILRDYLLDGGLLFADCGSPQWDRSFRAFAQVLLPGQSLTVISDDDPIFQFPFTFPNGAPPLWHHGGMRAMGIKHNGRWVVFYHPGDVNDAWKTGHSGMDASLAQAATEMGVNILYYAFTHYLEQTRKYRK